MASEEIPEPTDAFLRHATETIAAHPRKTAFTEEHPDPSILPPGKAAGTLTYRDLDERSDRVASKLRSIGIGRSDVVSFQLPNWVEFPIVYLGALKAGAATTPILTEHRASEVGFMVSLSRSDLIVVPSTFRGFDHVGMVADLLAEGTIDPEYVVVAGEFDAPDPRFKSFDWLLDAPADEQDPTWEIDDLEALMFTSGTTGEPKGVRQTGRVGYYQTVQPTEFLEMDAEETLFAPSPLAHNTGYHYLMRMGMLTGASVVLFDKWDPSAALDTLAAHDCTFSMGATTFLKDLLDQPDVVEYPLPALETFVLGGSAIPRPVVERAYDVFENVTVVAAWGQTENGIVTATGLDDPIERISQTDGRALPHCEVTVRTEYDGDAVRDSVGKLLMRGKSVMDGYHRRPEITAEAFTDDGWFKTGDLAIMDDDGYISIEGREKDIIIRGGENISAPEVEEHVLEHPAVQEVAVVAMPDERLQERPCAYLTLAPGHDPAEVTVESLSTFLEDRGVQTQKHPEWVEFVDGFPRTSTGKIQKFKLRDDIAEKVDDRR